MDTEQVSVEKAPGKRSLDAGESLESVARDEQNVCETAKHFNFLQKYVDDITEKRMRAELAAKFTNFIARPWQQSVLDIIAGPVVPCKVHWRWEPVGNTGKTYLAKYLHVVHAAFLCPGFDKKGFWRLYKGEKIVVFDFPHAFDFSKMYGVMSDLKDGHTFVSKWQSHTKTFTPPHVFVFAKHPPDESKLSMHKWDIVRL
jgi:hypothetical protein